MKPLSIILLLFLLSTLTTAQQNTIDSLKGELEATKNDTMRLVLLTQLSDSYIDVRYDSALFFAQHELQLAQKLGYKLQEGYALCTMGECLAILGDNVGAFQIILKGVKIAEDAHSEQSMLPPQFEDVIFYYYPLFFNKNRFSASKLRLEVLLRLRFTYMHTVGINEKTKQDFFQTLEMAKALQDTILMSNYYGALGRHFYVASDQLDSGFVYIQKAHNLLLEATGPGSGFLRGFDFMGFATYYLKKGNYALAFYDIQQAIQNHKAYFPRPGILWMDYLVLWELHFITGATDSSLFYAKRAYEIARQMISPYAILRTSNALVNLYRLKNNKDSLIKYLETSAALTDSLRGAEKLYSFADVVYNEEMHKKEIEAAKTELKNQIKVYALIAGLVALSIIAFILLRNNRQRKKTNILLQHQKEEIETQKNKVENTLSELKSMQAQLVQSLKQQASELEMQALRAQMNPHFIFNSLNSINRFILQKNSAQASEYLTKFSRLMRMILQNSQASLISLESELESLELYLNLEILRFDYHFDYKISVADDLDVLELKVPPLIIQPYVENAIWHGLMQKEEKGQLEIEVLQEENYLLVKVIDNGIGRRKAEEFASKSTTKHKSMGLKITADRIAMMRNASSDESVIKINDLVDPNGSAAGTEVIIKIPVVHD